MAQRYGVPLATALLVVGLAAAACGSSEDATPTPEPAGDATPRPSGGLFGPRQSFDPIELPLSGGLPRSVEFLGVSFMVDSARVTNTHPYTMFGEPRPGELLFVVLEVTAQNTTAEATRYVFNDEAFGFRTYSGQLLPVVEPIGPYDFSRLEPGASASDIIVFGTHATDVLDGGALLIGRVPDVPAVLPLTAAARDPLFPVEVVAVDDGPFQAGSIAWSIRAGEATLDLPAGVCCPDTGDRADDGELFVHLTLRGLVRGSQYGHASVTSDLVRLIIDGTPVEPFGFKGQANVQEGQSYDFEVTWLIASDASRVGLEVGAGTADARVVELSIGVPPPEPSPEPSVSPAPSSSPGASGSPTSSASPAASATASGVPTPSPAASP